MSKQYEREELQDGAGMFERWVGLPTRAGQRLHGLPRSAIYQGINSGKIKSACIKQPGKLTGKRVVFEKSVVDYIESFAVTVTPEAQK